MSVSTPTLNIQFSGDAPAALTTSGRTTMADLATTFTSTRSGGTLSKECEIYLEELGGNFTHTANVSDPAIRLVIASVTFVENLLVIIALLNSWRSLRQNIYIFALSIACSDCLLGFIHVANTIIVKALTSDEKTVTNSVIGQIGPSSWFHTIRATALMSAQVASTGNAACLVIAFKRYVDALAPSGATTVFSSRSSSNTRKTETTSRLLSRKTSYCMAAGVWILSLALGIIPLFWNCGKECACFINVGVHYTHEAAARCFENHGCSYLFPPLKSASYLMCLSLFIVTLAVLVVSCIQVIMAAGGMIAFLPYRLHKYYARRRRTSVESSVEPPNVPMRLRKRSVQMTYMRDMMNFLVLLSVTFVLCKLPSAALLFIESVTTEPLGISATSASFVVLLGYADSILNPIIFATTLHGMKEAFKKLAEPCCTTTISVSIGKEPHRGEAASTPPQQTTITTTTTI